MSALCTINVSNNGGWSKNFVYQDAFGAPISLTGVSLKMSIGPQPGEVLVALSTGSGGITITDAASGKFRIDITEDQLKRLSGTYQHDLVPTIAGLDGQPIWTGTFIVRKGITP